jgi:hypothetical protein
MSFLNDIVDLDEVLKDEPPSPGFSKSTKQEPGSACDNAPESNVNESTVKDPLDGELGVLPELDPSQLLLLDGFIESEPDNAATPAQGSGANEGNGEPRKEPLGGELDVLPELDPSQLRLLDSFVESKPENAATPAQGGRTNEGNGEPQDEIMSSVDEDVITPAEPIIAPVEPINSAHQGTIPKKHPLLHNNSNMYDYFCYDTDQFLPIIVDCIIPKIFLFL